MIITFILTLIAIFGTLAIVAYLKQMEDGMAELQEQSDALTCPVCHIPHHKSEDKKLYRRIKLTTRYYSRKRKAIGKYCNFKSKL